MTTLRHIVVGISSHLDCSRQLLQVMRVLVLYHLVWYGKNNHFHDIKASVVIDVLNASPAVAAT